MPPRPARPATRVACLIVAGVALFSGCSSASSGAGSSTASAASAAPSSSPAAPSSSSTSVASRSAAARDRLPAPFRHALPGMPRNRTADVYAADVPGGERSRVAHDPAYLYVPNSFGAPITTVIDQRTHRIVRVLQTGSISQHVTPSYDLKTLYVEASASNTIDAIDPRTARITHRFPVDRPYNLYFTPDGRHAVVMDEEHQRIVFADPRNFHEQHAISDPTCLGPNHADFSANGRYFLVTCEFSGTMLKISTRGERVVGRLDLGSGSKPQDVRLAPDGRSFYVADMADNQLLRIPWNRFKVTGRTSTPMMPHGIYPSRDGRFLYVSDRMAGEVSVFSLARHRIVDTWSIPGGATPDMGGVSADGRTLWLSGRTSGEIYGLSTRTGRLVARIAVPGGSPHGLLVWPQPGRYSLGHTGNMR